MGNRTAHKKRYPGAGPKYKEIDLLKRTIEKYNPNNFQVEVIGVSFGVVHVKTVDGEGFVINRWLADEVKIGQVIKIDKKTLVDFKNIDAQRLYFGQIL